MPASNFFPNESTNHTALLVMFGLGGLTYAINLLAILYCFMNRNYAPIKAKNISIMGISLFASISFWLGIGHSFGLFGWSGFWAFCSSFRVWAEFPLGVHLFLLVLCYRLLILYRLLVLHRKSTTAYRLGVIFAIYGPILIGYGVFEWLHLSSTFSTDVGCAPTLPWSIYSFAIVLIGILSLGWLTFALRKTPHTLNAFHEYKDTRFGAFALIAVYLVVSLIYFTNYNREFLGQMIILLLMCFSCNFYFWAVLWKPIYGCMFHREAALARFYASMGTIINSNNMSHHTQSYTMMPSTNAFTPTFPDSTYVASSPTYTFPSHQGYLPNNRV